MLSSKISPSGKIALLLNYNSPSVIAELSLLTVYFSRHCLELEFSRSMFAVDLCVSVRFNTTEAMDKCDLKPAKEKQQRFISVERLSTTTINVVNLGSGSIFSPSQSLLLRDLPRALRARSLRKVGSILNLSPLAKQSCGEVGKFDKSKSYSYVIKDAPTRRLA